MTTQEIMSMIKENHRLERVKRDHMTIVEMAVKAIAENNEKMKCWEYQREVNKVITRHLREEEC